MKRSLKFAIFFALIFLAVGTTGVLVYQRFQRLTEANQWVTPTQDVLNRLEHVLSLLKDAETGQRGFILVGEERYLQPYHDATGEIQKNIDAVAELTRDNPDQQRTLQQLRNLVREKLDELRETIALRRTAGLDAALPIIRSDRGQRTMDEIRDLIGRMATSERQLLDARDRAARQIAYQTLWAVLIGVILSLLALAVVAGLSLRSVRYAERRNLPQSDRRKRSVTVLHYGLAVVAVVLATGLRWWLEKAFGPMPLFLTWYPAVLLVASIGGGGPGIVATLLSALVADYCFINPSGSFSIIQLNDAVAMGFFVGTGIFMSILAERLRRARWAEALSVAQEQERAAQYARSLLEASLDPLVTISADGKITDVNEAATRATGVPRGELVGTDFSNYFTEPERAREGYKQVFARGFVTDYPLTVHHRNGTLMDVLYNASVYTDARGNVLGVFAAARDVTAQKQVEAELKRHKERLEVLVQERTAALEAANKDLVRSNENLGQFAYVASHDLQEPLRIMASFSQLLARSYKGRLDADADEFIGYIVDAAGRMQKLITDLLAYSRAGHKGAEREAVDCNQIVRRVVANMEVAMQAGGGRVTFDPLPTIQAHEASMIQLFQNLIGNALKFRGKEPPTVHVGARPGNHAWTFSVRDNGIGIEAQYYDRIFAIFQRLHTREEYSGTGIGLSICKKIVDNLGGRIWVESEVGKGTTFYFTIPSGESVSVTGGSAANSVIV